VTEARHAPLDLGEGGVKATKYEVTDDPEQHSWFDGSGARVQWRPKRQSAAITLVGE
jgi:hypothetical protein